MGALAREERAPRTGGRRALMAVAVLVLLALTAAPSVAQASRFRVQRLCGTPRPGAAQCQAMRLLPSSDTPAKIRANALAQARQRAAGRKILVGSKSPTPGYLTPQSLHAAYSLPSETAASSSQTIAVVDAYDDPTAEADLGVYDEQFGLPACTTANGCFRKINEHGDAGPLPPTEGEWASEISIDVQMARAICQGCHVLLVEADNEEFTSLGTAVNSAVAAGATEISNSYAGPEESLYTSYNVSYYNHPGVVITASSGDCGYLNKACRRDLAAANFPADSPDVVAVGGTSLSEVGKTWTSTVWSEGGSGCSEVFGAPLWQTAVANFAATGCGSDRAIADVAAIGDPNTGVDIYDSTPESVGAPTGWGVWGGTSVASPIIAAEFGLAGGSHGISYPAATLYSHAGEEGDLYDVVSGDNGSCSGHTICAAAAGFDGPTGVGSPIGLGAFASGGEPLDITPPSIAGIAEQGQTLTATQGGWSNSPTSIADQWEDCNSSGGACAPIHGATGLTYELGAGDVGSTIRVQETAINGSGAGSPAVSAQTATVGSDAFTFTGFTPASGITGSTVTLDGSGLGDATAVEFGTLAAQFTVLSHAQIEAIVPDGAKAAKISVTTPAGTITDRTKFKPTLSVVSFSPVAGPPGKAVRIKGIGFTSSSSVSFGGVPATSVAFGSSTKLTAIVPAGAAAGPITVTNTTAPLGSVSSAAGFSAG